MILLRDELFYSTSSVHNYPRTTSLCTFLSAVPLSLVRSVTGASARLVVVLTYV